MPQAVELTSSSLICCVSKRSLEHHNMLGCLQKKFNLPNVEVASTAGMKDTHAVTHQVSGSETRSDELKAVRFWCC